ncbi:MAG: SDR family oxidoreductase [Thermoanaerobaculia bacterium]|nr:SDR family oxidoreductase [Thermoanaerobaculia bacterium]
MIHPLPGPRSERRSGDLPDWDETAADRMAEGSSDAGIGALRHLVGLLESDPVLGFHEGGTVSVRGEHPGPGSDPIATLWTAVGGTGGDPVPLALRPLELRLEGTEPDDSREPEAVAGGFFDREATAAPETILLHASLPHRCVLHARPDAVLTLTQTPGGTQRARDLWGDRCLVLPWCPTVTEQARSVGRAWESKQGPFEGAILLNEGVLVFSDDARTAWESLRQIVGPALDALPDPEIHVGRGSYREWSSSEIAELRRELSRLAGRPLILTLDAGAEAREFAAHPEVESLSGRGPLSPWHVDRTRRTPAVIRDPGSIVGSLARWTNRTRAELRRLGGSGAPDAGDPAPRIVVAPGTGIFAAGADFLEARETAEIYRRTATAIRIAEALGGWRPLAAREVYELERGGEKPAPVPEGFEVWGEGLPGRVALVAGAAGGIGRATVGAFRALGASVAALDRNPVPEDRELLSFRCELSGEESVRASLEEAVRRFGGVDLLVSTVGEIPPGEEIEELTDERWARILEANAGTQLTLLRETIPLLRRACGSPVVVFVGSRNVAAPGPRAAAYSASKAALTQLARVAAVELAPHGIRVNVVHPDGVFDTGLWSEDLLFSRARAYGMSVEEYKTRNLLRREVPADAVGRLAAALCTDLFAYTTGAQIPVDGGNLRVI